MAADLTPAALLARTGLTKDFPLPSDGATIGYESGNRVRIPIEGVSRHHARIVFENDAYWIEDLGSSNGTFLNGALVVKRERLRHLDIVSLGRRSDLIFVLKSVGRTRLTRRGIVKVWLEEVDGPEAGTRREIPRGSVTLGRSPANNILVDSQLVSKAHARIERSGLEVVLTDLQSANGTFVEGKRILSRPLANGDEFNLGKGRTFRVHVEEGQVETHDVASVSITGRIAEGLPTDWQTRLDWTPEEKAVFDAVRVKPPAAAAPPATPAKKAPAADKPVEKTPKREKKEEMAKPRAAASAAPAPTPPRQAPPAPASKLAPAPAPGPPPAKGSPPATAAPEPTPSKLSPAASASAKPPAPPAVVKEPAAAPPVESTPVASPPVPGLPPPASSSPPATKSVPAGRADSEPTRAIAPAAADSGAPTFLLVLESAGRTFTLRVGDHEVGRVGVGVSVDTPEISRRHAVIHVTDSGATVEDLASRNGTFVNGERISSPHALANGDTLQFGGLSFRVSLAAISGS